MTNNSTTMNRNDRGQFSSSVTLDDVLGVFDAVDGPVVTSGDVAERTGCSRDSARRKLNQLHEQGEVGRRKSAGRVLYWRRSSADWNPVDPEDPFFSRFPTFASGQTNLSEQVDDLVYGQGP